MMMPSTKPTIAEVLMTSTPCIIVALSPPPNGVNTAKPTATGKAINNKMALSERIKARNDSKMAANEIASPSSIRPGPPIIFESNWLR